MSATAPTRTLTTERESRSEPSATSTPTAGGSGKRSYLPDPKPPRRRRDRRLMDQLRSVPCQVTGRLPATSHHLIGGASRSDDRDGIFRLASELHDLFHSGSEQQRGEVARRIRGHMTEAQVAYVVRHKGVDFLEAHYPKGGQS